MGRVGSAEIGHGGDVDDDGSPVRAAGSIAAPVAPVAPVAAAAVLRFVPQAPGSTPTDGLTVVLDTTWGDPSTRGDPSAGATADVTDRIVGLRSIAERVLGRRDLIAETSALLDDWAERADVVDATTVDGTSFWFYGRLDHWLWLQERVLWLGIVDELVGRRRFSRIECAPGTDGGLVAAARAIAARDGWTIDAPDDDAEPDAGTDAATPSTGGPPPGVVAASGQPSSAPARPTRSGGLWTTIARIRSRAAGGPPPDSLAGRRRRMGDRVTTLADEPDRRLLVLLQHAPQRVDGPTGPRLMNAYLGPIVDRLRGTRLEPIEVDLQARLRDDATWERLRAPGAERVLPVDVVWAAAPTEDRAAADAEAGRVADRIAGLAVPVMVSGVDLGPALAARVAAFVRRSLGGQIVNQARARQLIRRLRPAAVLLADEYHRQEWLGAARLEGVASVAVQHGLIYRHHNGYIHRQRPASLRIPDRLYVFGDWEKRLLLNASVFRDAEVSVGGSPRLDLTPAASAEPADAASAEAASADRDAVRAELGVQSGDRMVVVSGTWGVLYRRFHYPIVLAHLVDLPLPRVHLVIKLHPGEADEGPYRAAIDNQARARGHAPPPVTVVRDIDLYRLLRAADAHLGVHSTVLTEAVAAGTPNLLASGLAGADLLGYVEAGVARPVRDGADLLAALADGAPIEPTAAARRAFLDDHFRPGSASRRIADELLGWLP